MNTETIAERRNKVIAAKTALEKLSKDEDVSEFLLRGH